MVRSAWKRRSIGMGNCCTVDGGRRAHGRSKRPRTDQLLRALEAVLTARSLRCRECGEENDDAHDAQPHAFLTPDPLTVFLEVASEEAQG
jgi:hypothetical protein